MKTEERALEISDSYYISEPKKWAIYDNYDEAMAASIRVRAALGLHEVFLI